MSIQNMARQHREFQSRLDDAKKLQLYAQSVVSKHHALDASLSKEKSKFKHWERKAKASAGKIARAKAEKDEAKQESKIARLAANTTSDTKATTEDDLARV